jgi:hypothetical protein
MMGGIAVLAPASAINRKRREYAKLKWMSLLKKA